ncbi:hypothetical protein CSV75_12410 [Sporosarcina sp. P18a]|uniref:hypothetical protein n=1 Tax=Sporosarcina sp. P18a TaxID=2048259 RepID=UPI000C16E136|nr:hypothetical protein [Sporosarcina sp. P18a]PIC79392.1 hypothetical protein CSV75_12410 [Sporosarcina sp. P18a]
MITVQDMFDYALEMDLSHLANSIYWALQKDKVTFQDDSKKLQAIEFDEVEIKRLMEKNDLNIGKVKLFVMDGPDEWYAFYLAEHSLDAYRLHEELFREQQSKITRADRLMINRMTFMETGAEQCLYEHKKEIITYPAYVGHAKAGERVLYRVEVGA